MSYNPIQMMQATSAMTKAIPGLQYDVARAWVTAEQGDNYNIVGVTYNDATGQHLFKYSSFDQGAQAAYNLLKSNPAYAGVLKALQTQDSQKQAAALIASPWNHPYYSSGSGASALRAVAGTTPSGTTTKPQPSGTGTVVLAGKGGSVTVSKDTGQVVQGAGNPGTAPDIGGIWGAIIGFFGGTIQNLFFDGAAITIGFIFVIIGLIMFLKGTSSPTEAVRSAANDAVGAATMAATGAVSPELAAGVAANRGRRGAATRPNININDAAGVRDSAPGFSSETPRVSVPQGYYHRKADRIRVTVVRQDKPSIPSGIKLVGPGAIPMTAPKPKRKRKAA